MSETEADHVEATVQQLADLHEEHARDITPLQRLVVGITALLGRPPVLAAVIAFYLAWMGFNAAASSFRLTPFDPFPFVILESATTMVGLFTALLILATQRREEEFSRRREQLTLQLAALSERKIAKVISLLEEQRRENPALSSRTDPEAEDMAQPTDPRRVLNRIVETHEPEPGAK
ncbi:MAG: DUF1003 domain-containing protein [Caulobacteraceae bacterium]